MNKPFRLSCRAQEKPKREYAYYHRKASSVGLQESVVRHYKPTEVYHLSFIVKYRHFNKARKYKYSVDTPM